ncbi:MAG: LysR family transcriptional regulator [Burkholderiales bacterium]
MRQLNLDHLQALREVVATGSFSAAARNLNLTQPAVSLQIRDLEARVGVRLVDRLGRRAHATPAGAELVAHAERLAREADMALATMTRYREGGRGRVRLATAVSVCTYLLPPILVRLREAHPDLEVAIAVDMAERAVERVVANDLDIGLVTLPVKPNPAVEVLPVREDPMVALIPLGAPPAPKFVTPEMLAERPLIFNARQSRMYALTLDWFAQAGVTPKPILELGNSEAIKSLVAAGLGVAILPMERADDPLTHGRVNLHPLRPRLTRQLGLVRRRDKPMEAPFSTVWEALRELSNV